MIRKQKYKESTIRLYSIYVDIINYEEYKNTFVSANSCGKYNKEVFYVTTE